MADVYSFLESFRFYKDKTLNESKQPKATHTNIQGGSYLIPSDKLSKFYDLYCKALENKKKLNILEVPRRDIDYGIVKVDFDFRYPVVKKEDDKIDLTRHYTEDTIRDIVEVYRNIISKYFKLQPNDLTCFVTERPGPYHIEGESHIRDGFHLIFNVGLPYSFQHVLRNMVIETIVSSKILEGINTLNTIDNIVDKSVVESNNWFMYGSRKPNLEAYLLTMELDDDGAEDDVSRWKLIDLVKTLSIRKDIVKREYKTPELEEEIKLKAPVKIKTTVELEKKKRAIEKMMMVNSSIPENFEHIKSLVNILSDERVNEYKTWFEVGACLFNISNSTSVLELWIEFSKRSPKFKDGECESYWYGKFKKENLGIGSLIFWAKTDNPVEYDKVRRLSIRHKLETSIRTPTHYDISSLIYEMYKHQYVCTSVKNKKWYRFGGNHWEPSEQGMCIRFLLSKEISTEYFKYGVECGQTIVKLNSADGNSESDNLINGLQERVKVANKIATSLKTTSFKDNILKECCELFYDGEFYNKIDSNLLLLGMQNGVYDLKAREFRVGRPDDYISKKVNVEYIEYDLSDPEFKKKVNIINEFFNKILPIESVRRYMWLTLASCLEGCTDAKFPILTGTGGNGKTILLEFLEETFGDYACKVSTTIFTHKSSSPSAASPEIARIRNVRIVSAEETEEGSTLNVARMKELTGGNKITTRKLFEDIEEFKPQAHWFLVCNNLPNINSDDGGTWRRIHIVEFISSFVDDPEAEQYKGIPYIYKKDESIGRKLSECRDVFLSLLINVWYPEYKNNGIKEPSEVTSKTNVYRQENDIYFQFIKDRIQKDPNSVLKLTEAYGDFKHWYKNSSTEMKMPPSKEFRKYFERKFGSYGNARQKNEGWKGIALIPKEIDLDTPAYMEEKEI
jgi:P4 family phage/plasmid primase-like protien